MDSKKRNNQKQKLSHATIKKHKSSAPPTDDLAIDSELEEKMISDFRTFFELLLDVLDQINWFLLFCAQEELDLKGMDDDLLDEKEKQQRDSGHALAVLEKMEGRKIKDMNGCNPLKKYLNELEGLQGVAGEKQRWSLVCFSLNKLHDEKDKASMNKIQEDNYISIYHIKSEWKKLTAQPMLAPTANATTVKLLDDLLGVMQHFLVNDMIRTFLRDARSDHNVLEHHPFQFYTPEDLINMTKLVRNDLAGGARLLL